MKAFSYLYLSRSFSACICLQQAKRLLVSDQCHDRGSTPNCICDIQGLKSVSPIVWNWATVVSCECIRQKTFATFQWEPHGSAQKLQMFIAQVRTVVVQNA